MLLVCNINYLFHIQKILFKLKLMDYVVIYDYKGFKI